MTIRRVAINVLIFQAAWFAIVVGAARGEIGLVVAATVLAVSLHLALCRAPFRELAAAASVAVIGAAWDSVPVAAGWMEYRGASPFDAAAPYWIAALWLVFATTLNVSLRWLRSRASLAAAFGAVIAPLCYLGGEVLGALRFLDRPAALVAEAAAWSVLLPGSVAIAARLDGASRSHAHA